MSRAQDDVDRLRRQYRLCVQASALAGVISTLPLILAGEQLVTLLYGGKYEGTGVFVAVLGAACAVRFLRFAPAGAALAKADTINQLNTAIWRGASLPLALGVLALGGTPMHIAACALFAEVLAAVVSVVRLWRRQGVPLQESYGAGAYVVTMISIGLVLARFGTADLGILSAAVVATVAFLIALCTAWFLFPEATRFISEAAGRNSRGRAL